MLFEQTQRTPRVELSSTACHITGECYPENIQETQGPIQRPFRDDAMQLTLDDTS